MDGREMIRLHLQSLKTAKIHLWGSGDFDSKHAKNCKHESVFVELVYFPELFLHHSWRVFCRVSD